VGWASSPFLDKGFDVYFRLLKHPLRQGRARMPTPQEFWIVKNQITTNIQQPTVNNQQSTTNSQQLTVNNQQSTIMSKPSARITDAVAHPLPPVLTGGPGSSNVFIGSLPAWRGVPAASAAAIQAAKSVSDNAIKVAEAATLAAAGTPGAPAAKIAEEGVKAASATAMSSTITSSAGGADIHNCATPLPLPPHGPGVVIDGSKTVLINGLPAARMGDTIVEALGPPNKIAAGCPTVVIGG
jgi:uncharacterized Zn-binding protein involved in type VI secretion